MCRYFPSFRRYSCIWFLLATASLLHSTTSRGNVVDDGRTSPKTIILTLLASGLIIPLFSYSTHQKYYRISPTTELKYFSNLPFQVSRRMGAIKFPSSSLSSPSINDESAHPNEEYSHTSNQEAIVNAFIDVDIALSAARVVSHAHLQNFKSNGRIVIRRVWSIKSRNGLENLGSDNNIALSAAAGVACRLLECQALSRVGSNRGEDNRYVPSVLKMILPTTDDAVSTIAMSPTFGDMNLAIGDVWAEWLEQKAVTLNDYNDNCVLFVAAAANIENDPGNGAVCYVDPLYNTRGETPTTVIQWSKGTIF